MQKWRTHEKRIANLVPRAVSAFKMAGGHLESRDGPRVEVETNLALAVFEVPLMILNSEVLIRVFEF